LIMVTVLKTQPRSDKGKSAAAKSRRNGLVPAVVYAHGEVTRELLVNEREFTRTLEAIKGKSTMIDMQIGDEPPIKCIVKSIQRDIVGHQLMHVDFQKVHANEKLTISIPIHLEGTPVGLKMGGLLEHTLREIPVRGLPDNLPANITLDIAGLKVGQSLHISDIKLANAEIQLPATAPIASVLSPRKEEVVAPTAEAAAAVEGEAPKEPEVLSEKKTAERAEERAKSEAEAKGGKPAKEDKKPDAKKPEKKEEKKK
jgi:large subunit ribosomal protein L25